MNEELKEIILREHPAGIWVVLADELPQSFEPDFRELAGHPITESSQAADSSFVPRRRIRRQIEGPTGIGTTRGVATLTNAPWCSRWP